MATKARAKTKQAEFGPEIFDTEKVKETFEKSFAYLGDLGTFGKENMDAWMETATITGKGIEALSTETATYTKVAMEQSAEAAKAAFSAKNIQEIVEIQSDFSKTIFDAYLAQVNKVAELVSETTTKAAEPINGRVNAFVNLVQGAR